MSSVEVDMQQLQREINEFVQRAVAAALQNLRILQGPLGLPGLSGQSSTPGEASASSSISERWNPSDLDYFNSYLDKLYNKGKIVIVEKDIYFRSVILFTDRIKDLIIVKGAAVIKSYLSTSLRETTLL